MSERTDNLTEEKAVALIADLRRTLDELKNKQIVGGASLRFYTNVPPNTEPDAGYGVLDVTVLAYGYSMLVVKFTNDVADWSFADLTYQIYQSGVEIFPGDTNYPGVEIWNNISYEPMPRIKWWFLKVIGPGSTDQTYRFRFTVQSSSTGGFQP